MSLYPSLWMYAGSLSLVLVAVGTTECTEQESLLQEISSSITEPTQCLMNCTVLTFARKIQLGDNHNIRLKDSAVEEYRNLKEYCWPLDLKCTVGERLHTAFVVVPVAPSAVTRRDLAVRSTGPVAAAGVTLSAHDGPTALADACGIRYEVTPAYRAPAPGAAGSFCVQVIGRRPLPGDGALACPPFLVTVWRRAPGQQAQREGGG